MISIVIPTMNEEKTIGAVIERIRKSVKGEYEIIVVDKSNDRTPEIAKSMGARVIHEERRGYGRAYKTGFEHANGEIIVTMDGDNTYPPEVINDYVKYLIENNIDFISCDRLTYLDKRAMSQAHRFGNFVLNIAVLALFFIKIKDSQSGMWIFRKDLLKKIRVYSDGMPFSEELKIEAWYHGKAVELPIHYGLREGERKLQTFKDGLRNLIYLFKKRFIIGIG